MAQDNMRSNGDRCDLTSAMPPASHRGHRRDRHVRGASVRRINEVISAYSVPRHGSSLAERVAIIEAITSAHLKPRSGQCGTRPYNGWRSRLGVAVSDAEPASVAGP